MSEHGLIGDTHCVALVGTNGTIDWYCCPDGLRGAEGTFSACSFWYVEALTHLALISAAF